MCLVVVDAASTTAGGTYDLVLQLEAEWSGDGHLSGVVLPGAPQVASPFPANHHRHSPVVGYLLADMEGAGRPGFWLVCSTAPFLLSLSVGPSHVARGGQDDALPPLLAIKFKADGAKTPKPEATQAGTTARLFVSWRATKTSTPGTISRTRLGLGDVHKLAEKPNARP